MGGSGKQNSGSGASNGTDNSGRNLSDSDNSTSFQKKKPKGKHAAANRAMKSELALKKALDNKANQNNPNHPSYWKGRGKTIATKQFIGRNGGVSDYQKDMKKLISHVQTLQGLVVEKRKNYGVVTQLPTLKEKKKQMIANEEIKKPIFRGGETFRNMVLSKLKHAFKPQVIQVHLKKALAAGHHLEFAKRLAVWKGKKSPIVSMMAEPIGGYGREDGLAGKVRQMTSKEKKVGFRNFKASMNRDSMMKMLVIDMEKDEIAKNRVAYMLLCAILMPEMFANIGIPDSYNSSRSGKPTIITEYVLPFRSDNSVAVLVADDPIQHITILGGGTAEAVIGPIWKNADVITGTGQAWSSPQNGSVAGVVTADPYATANKTTTFKVNSGQDDAHPMWWVYDALNGGAGKPSGLEVVQFDGKTYNYLPCKESDTCRVVFSTPDTTSGGFNVIVNFVKRVNGVLSIDIQTVAVTGGTPTTGLGIGTATAPAGTLGVYSYSVQNASAGTDATVNSYVSASVARAAGDIILPCGKANGDDVTFLNDFADEYRSVNGSVLSSYFGGYLDNGLILQGQFPQDGDFEIPEPTVENWSLIPGFLTKPLNDANDPGAYCPFIKRDYTTVEWQSLNNDVDEEPTFERVGVYVKANGADAEYVKIRTALQLQYRTEAQTVYTDEGISMQEAIDLVQTWLMENTNGGTDLVFGNCDHGEQCEQLLRKFEKDRGGTTFSFFNGWFSGNETNLKNVAI